MMEAAVNEFDGQLARASDLLSQESQKLFLVGIVTIFGTALLATAFNQMADNLRQTTVSRDILMDSNERLEAQGAELAALADRLAVARDDAESASKAKSSFLAMMSHELRTPLNAVFGFSEIIKSQSFGPLGNDKYGEYAEDIHTSGQHLLSLINDILDLSKVESGAEELHEQEFDLSATTHTVVRLVTERAQRGGVKLNLAIAAELPLLHADERKLKQILLNLLSNAIKFTPTGGRVELTIECAAGSGHVIRVADTGIGIKPEDIPKALNMFAQVDSEQSRKYAGTGLGLPLTKAPVEIHDGEFDLQSEFGVGTTITLRFPAERVVPLPESVRQSA